MYEPNVPEDWTGKDKPRKSISSYTKNMIGILVLSFGVALIILTIRFGYVWGSSGGNRDVGCIYGFLGFFVGAGIAVSTFYRVGEWAKWFD